MSNPIDPNVAPLVDELNQWGVETIGSCGGHENHRLGQWPAGAFYVKFRIPGDPGEAWGVLEWLAWAVNQVCSQAFKGAVMLVPTAPPPYLNGLGNLAFSVEGTGVKPEVVAKTLANLRAAAARAADDEQDGGAASP
jgi:hypothetical protein